MLLYKQQKKKNKGNRFLISVTVLGSAGPIRLVVNEKEVVAAVIDAALKSYARQGRLPILGSDVNHFMLYCPNIATRTTEALSPWHTIGSVGFRNFMLCKNPQMDTSSAMSGKGSASSWRAWFHKSLNLKISTH